MTTILHNGTKKPIEQAFADSHAAAMSLHYTFDMVYNDPWDSGQPRYQMDSSTVAFIANVLPALSVDEDTTVYWHTTIHGIVIRVEDYHTTRLERTALVVLGSDPRIRWAEITIEDTPTLNIGLMFLKEYEAL